MKAGKKILIGFIISGLVIAALAFSFDRIVVFVIEKACSIGQFKEAYDLDIRFNHCWPTFSGQLIFDKLSIISRKTGFGFACKKAELKPIFGSKDFALDFDLRDVSFTKEAVSEEPRYDSITALVATPFNKNWKYGYIRGRIEPVEKRVGIKDFELSGNDIKAKLNGSLSYDGLADFDIIIYFSPILTAKIPPELSSTLLSEEKDGWQSLSVKLAGDPNKPSVQISSKRFRLNIKSVSGV